MTENTTEAHPGPVESGPDTAPAKTGEQIIESITERLYTGRQVARLRELLTRLHAVRRSGRFYPLDHPAVIEGVKALFTQIEQYFDEGVDLELSFFEGEIVLGEQLLPEESILFDQLLRDMADLGVGSLGLLRGMNLEETSALVGLLVTDPEEVERAGGIERMVEHLGLQFVRIGPVRLLDREGDDTGEPGEAARQSYSGALQLMREIDRLVHSNKSMGATRVKGAVRSLVDSVLTNRHAMLQLTGLKNYDEYTFYHSANVAILALALGSTITTDYRFLSSLGVGALLHDIGKLTVDIDILNKPGALSADEWARVRQHPVYGAETAARMPGIDRSAIVIILEHHMRYDGSGYPQRKPRRRQHLASRVVAVADSFDAMTSRRSYSVARVQDEAMALLAKSAGSALDPVLVQRFISMMGVYPPRSAVRLSSGEVAVVLQPGTADATRPIIRVIAGQDGTLLEPRDVDLTDSDLSIKRCLDPRALNIDVDDYL